MTDRTSRFPCLALLSLAATVGGCGAGQIEGADPGAEASLSNDCRSKYQACMHPCGATDLACSTTCDEARVKCENPWCVQAGSACTNAGNGCCPGSLCFFGEASPGVAASAGTCRPTSSLCGDKRCGFDETAMSCPFDCAPAPTNAPPGSCRDGGATCSLESTVYGSACCSGLSCYGGHCLPTSGPGAPVSQTQCVPVGVACVLGSNDPGSGCCSGLTCFGGACTPTTSTCGDGICGLNESHQLCPADCAPPAPLSWCVALHQSCDPNGTVCCPGTWCYSGVCN